MGTVIWDGSAADNDWSTAANWDTAAVPVDGDDVIFDGRTTQDATSGMGQGAIDLASLTIMSSYTGTIGAAGAPLEIEISGDLLIEGTGSYYIQSAAANATTDGSIDRTIINTTGSVFLSSMNNDGSNDTDFVTVIANAGTITIYGDADKATTGAEAGTVIGTLILSPTYGRGGGLTVTNGDLNYKINGTVLTDVIMYGGAFYNHTLLDQLDVFGGTCTIGHTSYSMSATDDSINTLNLHGGTVNWQPSVVSASVRTTASASPIIIAANIYGGTFDASGMLETVTTAPTITTCYLHKGAIMNLNNGYANFIVTTLKDYGGTIIKSATQALTLS